LKIRPTVSHKSDVRGGGEEAAKVPIPGFSLKVRKMQIDD